MGGGRLGGDPAEAEVGDDGALAPVVEVADEDRGGLEVAVDDLGRVEIGDAARDVGADVDGLLHGELSRLEVSVEGLALEEVQDEEHAVRLVDDEVEHPAT